MMTDELFIRADADSQIGIGHVIRCLALSQAWQDRGGRSTFIAARLSPALQAMLEGEGIRIYLIDARPGSRKDAHETKALVKKFNPSWIVLDGYHFEANYQKTLKDSNCRLLCIDDNGHADFYSADIILNQNLHADERLYAKKVAHALLLLGPRFCLLRRQFRDRTSSVRKTASIASRLLVTMGGGDQNNVTLRVVKAIKRIGTAEFTAKIVFGQTNPHLYSLTRVIGDIDGAFTLLKNVADMAGLMAWADMAISGGGSTCWEMACMGLPAVVLTTFVNQQQNTERLSKLGVIKALGWHQDCEDANIVNSIELLATDPIQRNNMSQKAEQLVDGHGVIRTIQSMRKI